jgi:hypothetical protein
MARISDKKLKLHELALETVRLQARRPMSPEEERLLANNLVDILLGRGHGDQANWMALRAAIDQHHCQQCSDCGRRFNVRMRRRLQPVCARS